MQYPTRLVDYSKQIVPLCAIAATRLTGLYSVGVHYSLRV